MAFSGGVIFYNDNIALAADGSTIVASSGNSTSGALLDRNPNTKWRSIGSDDITTETITLTLPSSLSFNRLWVIDHNWKEFLIDYDDGGFTDFSSVIGLDGALGGGITETAYADSTLYYEFATVTTDIIRFRVTKTFVVDDQKEAGQIILATDIGTLVGFPEIEIIDDRQAKVRKALSGRVTVGKSRETFSVNLSFNDYPTQGDFNADFELMRTLFRREDPFLVWLSGGNRGTDKFSFDFSGMRLRDVIPMQIIDSFAQSFTKNIYVGPGNLEVSMVEHT